MIVFLQKKTKAKFYSENKRRIITEKKEKTYQKSLNVFYLNFATALIPQCYPLSCCIVLVPQFIWKARLLICNWVFYICTFEMYFKFIHFLDDTFFELFSLDNVCYSLNNKLKRCFYMGRRNTCRAVNMRSAKLNSGKFS